MKTHLALILFIFPALQLAANALPREAHLTVDGMVCAYCAAGIVDAFKAQDEVAGLTVDFDNAIIRLKFVEGSSLNAEKSGRIIYDMGYEMAGYKDSEKTLEEGMMALTELWGNEPGANPSTLLVSAEGEVAFARLTFPNDQRSAWLSHVKRDDAVKEKLAQINGKPAWWDFENDRRDRGFVGSTPSGKSFIAVSDRHQRIWHVAFLQP